MLDKGIAAIHERESELAYHLIGKLSAIDHVNMYGKNLKDRGPLVSLSIDGIIPADVAYILQSNYNIITRAGLQCAPLIHEYIGAGQSGTLRVSFSDETTTAQLDVLAQAVGDIAHAANG